MGKSLHSPKDIVRERSEGMCERCGVILTRNVNGCPESDSSRSVHHRQPRRHGGKDSVINLVNLCIRCHRLIHSDEKRFALDGWIVLDRNPIHVPFLGWRGWVLPDTEGGLALLDFAAGRLMPLLPPPARGTTRRQRVATRSRQGFRKSRKSVRVA